MSSNSASPEHGHGLGASYQDAAPEQLDQMPGHWLLAQLGKRVLRPGGMELTQRMLLALRIQPSDQVVEVAPGLGATASQVLAKSPASYRGVERDPEALRMAQKAVASFSNPDYQVQQGSAEATGLEEASASVFYGEAMLTMQAANRKKAMVEEAFRVLKPGGRYGIHELGLVPDDLAEADKNLINKGLQQAIRVNARPLTEAEWRSLLTDAGFVVKASAVLPMHLLEPARLIQDEGLKGALRFGLNLLKNKNARARVLKMKRLFKDNADKLRGIMLVAEKPSS